MLGLSLHEADQAAALPAEVQKLVNDRQTARAAKDWAKSDQLRDAILDMGYLVQDTKEGMKVIRK